MAHNWQPAMYSHAEKFGSVTFTSDEGKRVGSLDFQDGPIQEHGVNGVTNEEVIIALAERLNGLNQAPFNCRENSLAITHLEEALHWLQARTTNRQVRGVEGTYQP